MDIKQNKTPVDATTRNPGSGMEDVISIHKDRALAISFLVTDEFIEFFTNQDSAFDAVIAGDGTNRCEYHIMMDRFKEAVLKAYSTVCPLSSRKSNKPIWARMREKYYDGRSCVYPDEMIEHINYLLIDELVAFLHYCVIYKERFCDGAYGIYAKEGIIGQILLRLRELSPEYEGGFLRQS